MNKLSEPFEEKKKKDKLFFYPNFVTVLSFDIFLIFIRWQTTNSESVEGFHLSLVSL